MSAAASRQRSGGLGAASATAAAGAAAAPAPVSGPGRTVPPRQGPRSTRQRAAVAELLGSTTEFRSAQELHRMLVDGGDTVGLATVYRTLQVLADAGEVDALRSPDGEVRYRRCVGTGHHHHLVCRECGRTEELDAAAVEEWVAAMAARSGFRDVEHTIELFGRCAACTAAAATS